MVGVVGARVAGCAPVCGCATSERSAGTSTSADSRRSSTIVQCSPSRSASRRWRSNEPGPYEKRKPTPVGTAATLVPSRGAVRREGHLGRRPEAGQVAHEGEIGVGDDREREPCSARCVDTGLHRRRESEPRRVEDRRPPLGTPSPRPAVVADDVDGHAALRPKRRSRRARGRAAPSRRSSSTSASRSLACRNDFTGTSTARTVGSLRSVRSRFAEACEHPDSRPVGRGRGSRIAAGPGSSVSHGGRHRAQPPDASLGEASMNLAVLGAGSWGTTIASLVAARAPTTLWAPFGGRGRRDTRPTDERLVSRGLRPVGPTARDLVARRRARRRRARRDRAPESRRARGAHRGGRSGPGGRARSQPLEGPRGGDHGPHLRDRRRVLAGPSRRGPHGPEPRRGGVRGSAHGVGRRVRRRGPGRRDPGSVRRPRPSASTRTQT